MAFYCKVGNFNDLSILKESFTLVYFKFNVCKNACRRFIKENNPKHFSYSQVNKIQ